MSEGALVIGRFPVRVRASALFPAALCRRRSAGSRAISGRARIRHRRPGPDFFPPPFHDGLLDQPPAPPAVTKKPLYRKKRFYIPVGAFLILGFIGAVSPSPEAPRSVKTPSVTNVDSTKAEADRVATAKAAAEQAATQKVEAAEAKAAAARAAAEKAAAAKAAAEKAAAEKAAAEKAAAEKAAAETAGQENARRAAESYLGMSAFSRSGLIEQLKFEGYSTRDATYGVDSQHASWNTQAARAAESYLGMSAFSRSGLVEQLMFEGYTRTQAEYGVKQAGL
jgi:hypothetical protein